MDFVGIDLHKTSSQICILSEGGELTERRIKSTGAGFDDVFAGRPRARTLVEASTESEWVAQHLEGLGAYRHAHRTSERQRKIRAQLLVRSTLVRTRSKYISLIGSLARREGCRIATGGSNNFAARVEAANLPAHVTAAFAPLIKSLKILNRQINEADAELEKIVKEDEVVRRLCTAPGVGPVTATTFAATIDNAYRFGPPSRSGRTSASSRASTARASASTAGASARREAAGRGRYWWRRRGRYSGGGTRRTRRSTTGR